MRLLKLQPDVYKFDSFKEFAEEFKIGKGDLLFTHEFIYQEFIKQLNLEAEVLFQEKYGTGEPSDEMINAIFEDVNKLEFNRIIAVGGGSVVDIAKLFVLKDAKDVLELFEKRVPLIKEKELIIIPTTCGTGSEVTNISMTSIKAKKTKMGLAVDELYADYAVLIPELVKGLPYSFFVTSSIDALVHAVESYVSPKSNPVTEMFGVKAMELILSGYKQILEHGRDYRTQIIEDFVVASNYAGIAFGNTGVGAVHAISYPISGIYHVPHGEANYLFFTEVFKNYQRKNPEGKIKELNKILAGILKVDQEDVYDEITSILDKLLSVKPLREYGMKEEEKRAFAKSVIENQQRLLVNNYVSLSEEEIFSIYENLF
ncbi:4-hydroxybutyrate dehydrogenase [Clostridium ganghwense]|uniref:4-hydroxybutyrate dehydrogenase n=1 Tax=Clostridium ganghwense TaxID=312089 RepID=A0ABT4CTZ5_9CLOT|nr:4-hydroxybutyrate dehydrogenase [Clostridium ganghwense]MCY6371908.1 4-hydroxybutyrate dehydrogenase [Clostridium ganghwense]